MTSLQHPDPTHCPCCAAAAEREAALLETIAQAARERTELARQLANAEHHTEQAPS